MQRVDKNTFYETIGPRDVIITNERYVSYFKTRQGVIVGKITPGYLCEDETGKYVPPENYEYFIA